MGRTYLGYCRGADGRQADHCQCRCPAADGLRTRTTVVAIAGDIADPDHRAALAKAATDLGPVDLVVNNASTLGASPMPRLADLTPDVLDAVLLTNVVAPHALTRALLPQLVARRGTVLNITSDASVEAYEGWGAYGASKAALDHLTRILAA